LPDPCDEHCPKDFKTKARSLLARTTGRIPSSDEDLRHAVLKFIGDFADWDLAANPTYLEVSRGLVKAAYPGDTPLIVDPFAGGGSIPLEALRLGCETFASDLNPVACLVLKVLLEDLPRHGSDLADELRRVGGEIKQEAEDALGVCYPVDPNHARPIAYLWARTARCEAPTCGAEIPLLRSFWLSKKANRKRALRYRVRRPKGQPPQVEFEIFERANDLEVAAGTVRRARAACICCSSVLSPDRIRAQLREQRGGADVMFDGIGRRVGGARLLAVVLVRQGEAGRHYRLASEDDYAVVQEAQSRLARILEDWQRGGTQAPCPVPDETIDPWHHDVNRMPMYGMSRWGDLFTARQKVALITYTELIRSRGSSAVPFSLLLSRLANGSSSLCRWNPNPSGFAEKIESTFARQALPILWDFAETSPLAGTSGDWDGALTWLLKVVHHVTSSLTTGGSSSLADATEHPLPSQTAAIWFTDPPYYDAIDYAHCSDFFFVWLKRAIPWHPLMRDPFDPANPLTPKAREIVVDSTTTMGHGIRTPKFYEDSMSAAFAQGRRILLDGGAGSVVFAHKTTEGWEALLSGMIRGGWTITGSWPLATEMGSRLRARESAALATSVHLICRPRFNDAQVGDWASVLRELPSRVGDWMERLQGEGVRGADLVFACIGPALEIFSRYAKVETADGREVTLAEYLEKVWEVVGRSALAQVLGTPDAKARNGAAGAVEEDARLTALFLWTLQSTSGEPEDEATQEDEEQAEEADEEGSTAGKAKGFTLVFDVVRRFAQALGIELPKWEGRIIETKKGVVRLLPIAERAKQLFGEDGAQAVAARIEREATTPNPLQGVLFPDQQSGGPTIRGRGRGRGKRGGTDVSDESLASAREATTLDRVHATMLLQAGGRTNALRALLKAEQERGPDFLRLANALSALYPKGSEEKRLLDAMLLAMPR